MAVHAHPHQSRQTVRGRDRHGRNIRLPARQWRVRRFIALPAVGDRAQGAFDAKSVQEIQPQQKE